jgi:hypothetical protein
MTAIGCSAIPGVGAAQRRRGAQDDKFASTSRVSKSALLFAFIALFVSAFAAATLPLASIKLAEASPPIEVVRCHFDEGRIVVRHADTLHVLHAGDEVDSLGLRLMEITPEAATLALRQAEPAVSLRIIKITESDSGTVLIREFATDPSALTTGAAPSTPQAPVSAAAASQPKSSPDGD